MPALEFKEIAELLRYTRTAEISSDPVKSSPGNWDVFEGQYRVHTQTLPFEVLYIHSRAAGDSLRQAKREVFTSKKTQVVYAPSLNKRTKAHQDLFKADAAGFWTTKQYLVSFMREELDAYIYYITRSCGRHLRSRIFH